MAQEETSGTGSEPRFSGCIGASPSIGLWPFHSKVNNFINLDFVQIQLMLIFFFQDFWASQ